jgi:DHA1 family multidrug resistance protein-like MFS transporter
MKERMALIQATGWAAMLSASTFVPILARDYLGADEFFITIMVGSYATAAFFSSYIFGRAGDIYGRRIILQFGLLLSIFSLGCLVFATSPGILFIVRVTNGFCLGMYPGALAAYAYESKLKMGRFASFGAIGWAAGLVFVGYFAALEIYYAFVLAAVFFVIAFASALTLPQIERKQIEVPWFPVDTLKRNQSVYIAVLIRHSSVSAVWTLWSLYLVDLGGDYWIIGIIQAMNSISQAVFMILLTDRLNYRTLISLGLLTSMLTFVSLTFVTNIWEVFPSQIILGLSWACLYVGSLKYLTENNEDRSTASGLLTSILSLSSIMGPIMASILYTLWPAYIPLFLNAIFMCLLAFIFFRVSCKDSSFCEIIQDDEIQTEVGSV